MDKTFYELMIALDERPLHVSYHSTITGATEAQIQDRDDLIKSLESYQPNEKNSDLIKRLRDNKTTVNGVEQDIYTIQTRQLKD